MSGAGLWIEGKVAGDHLETSTLSSVTNCAIGHALGAQIVASLVQRLELGEKPSTLAREVEISRMTLHRFRTKVIGEDADAVLVTPCEGDAYALRPKRLAGVPASLVARANIQKGMSRAL